MAATLTGKFCGTCEYWSGARAVGKGGVQCYSTGEKGHCQFKTMSKTTPHQANQPGCPKYIRLQQI